MNYLNEQQQEKLRELIVLWLQELTFKASDFAEGEVNFTNSYLRPQVNERVGQMNSPHLYVRGDGGLSPIPATFRELYWYPDISIVAIAEKYIAFEVKIITNSDGSGAFSKAVGQSLLYSKFGYKYSIGLVFDLRTQTNASIAFIERLSLSSDSEIFLFA